MAIEIERKFLVNREIWERTPKNKHTYIKQGYLNTSPDLTIRVRLKDEKAFLTIKGKSQGAARAEYEYEIPSADAAELLDNFTSDCLEKTRYEIQHENHLWEIDVFHGVNNGLIVAEVELQDERETVSLPPFVGGEVTGNVLYYNSNLIKNPYKNWATQ